MPASSTDGGPGTAAPVRIRPATGGDADAIRAVAGSAYLQYVEAIGRKPAPMVADFVKHLEDDTVFVAETGDGGGIAGYAVVLVKNGEYWLENIAVAPAQSGRGVGSALVKHVEAWISRRADMYRLYTNVKMERNIGWYRRLGFEETGRALEDGFERVFFAKKL